MYAFSPFILETQVRPTIQLCSTVHSKGVIQTQSSHASYLHRTLSELVKKGGAGPTEIRKGQFSLQGSCQGLVGGQEVTAG